MDSFKLCQVDSKAFLKLLVIFKRESTLYCFAPMDLVASFQDLNFTLLVYNCFRSEPFPAQLLERCEAFAPTIVLPMFLITHSFKYLVKESMVFRKLTSLKICTQDIQRVKTFL